MATRSSIILSVFVALAIATTFVGAQVAYNSALYFYYAPAASYCYINTAASYGPFTCVSAPNIQGATEFTITGTNSLITSDSYAESPTVAGILNGGSLSKWCYPRNYTGNAVDSVYCSGAGITSWFSMIKVGGLDSVYIYNGDTVVLQSTVLGANCSLVSNVLECAPSSGLDAAVFTIII